MASGLLCSHTPSSSCNIVSVDDDGVMFKSVSNCTWFILPTVDIFCDSSFTRASSGVRAMYGFNLEMRLLRFVELIWLIIFPPGISIL